MSSMLPDFAAARKHFLNKSATLCGMGVKLHDPQLYRLTPEEDLLVQYFRYASPEDQQAILEMVKTAADLRATPQNVFPIRQALTVALPILLL